jgi:ribosomal protein S18 acetylase RimI-like enzyme
MVVDWRPLRHADLAAAQDLVRFAGWNQTEADWAGYLALGPGGCLAACADGALAGAATTIRYGGELGWIGMVLVHPNFRRLGLGSELLRRALRHLAEAGTRSVGLDATPLGRKVYLPLGFRDVGEVTRFEGTGAGEAAGAPPHKSVLGVRRLRPADLGAVVDLDTRAFGVARPEVLAALSRRNPEWCLVGLDGTRPCGYLVARQGREAVQAGPGVARDPAVAEDLFRALLAAIPGQRVFLDVPATNQGALEMVVRHGFRVQRSFTRMVLGPDLPPGCGEWILATSGAEKG